MPEAPEEPTGSVARAVADDLERLNGGEALRRSAMKVAQVIDDTTSPRDLATLTKELRAILAELEPTEERQADGVDEVAARREARRAAAAAAAGTSASQ